MSVLSPSSSTVSVTSNEDDSNTGDPVAPDPDREAILGFKPQKEIIYNLHLPYAAEIDPEANQILADIKAGLAKSIQLRDIGVGAVHWSGQLSKYIQLYGRRFSKEDHVLFIRLCYELMVMPTMELSWVQRYGNLLTSLLKKKELLSREDLVLPWRPLYELMERSLYSSYELHGLHLIPYNLEGTMRKVVKFARTYFTLESTQEMLDEWRPLMCPYDTSMIKAMKYFEMFLPTDLPPEHHDQGHKLWLEEFLQVLDCGGDSAPFAGSIKILLARLSSRNIGYIDWTDYIPRIFDSLLQNLDLPVGGMMNNATMNGHFGLLLQDHAVANWIVSLLGGGRPTQSFLNDFLKATETYFHPSNIGKWTLPLLDLLTKLTQALVNRIDRERNHHKTWIHPVPDAYKLTSDDITQFVMGMKPVAFLAMFSKRGLREASQVIQHLAAMRPELIIPPLLETAYPAMETLTEPHRLISCMTCLTAVSRIMMQTNKWYDSGRQHVLPLLYLALPGIDPNDTNKCMTSMQMISTFISLVPVVDCSQAGQTHELSDSERELCAATSQFEDYVLLFLEKLIALIESYSQDGHHHGQTSSARKLSPEENLMQKFISSTFNSIIQQCSYDIFKVVNRKLYDFITGSIYDIKVAGCFFGTMLKSLSKAHPDDCLGLFIPRFHQTVMAHDNEATRKAENLDGELLWTLTMLADVICCNGGKVLTHLDKLIDILDVALKLESKEGYEIAASILEHLLIVFSNTYLIEYCSVSRDLNQPISEHLPTNDWGINGDLKNINAKWHISSQEEKDAVKKLLERYLLPELSSMRKLAKGEVTMTRERVVQSLVIIDSCTKGFSSSVNAWQGESIHLADSEVPLRRHRQITSKTENTLQLEGQNPRQLVAESIRPLLDKMLNSTEDDTKSLLKLIDIYHHVLMFNGTKKDEFDLRWKSFHLFKRVMQNKLLGKKKHVRSLILHRIQLQHDLRLSNKDAKVFTERHKDMFLDLYRLSCSLYPEVRKKAQGVLNLGVSVFAYSSRVLIPSITISLSKDDSVEHHQFKGALYVLLGDRSKPRLAASKYWKPLLDLWPIIVQADHSEKPSILALIDRLVDRIHRQFESPSLERNTSDRVVETATNLWNSESTPKCTWEPASDTQIQKSRENEQLWNSEAQSDYHSLVEKLVVLVKSGKLQWKFHELALELLSLLLRHDIAVPAGAVEVFTSHLVHDSLMVRKLAINGMMAVVKSQKRRAKPLETTAEAVCPGPVVLPNGALNNQWLMLSQDYVLDNDKLENGVFMDKTHWGFYAWPKVLKYHAPPSQQPSIDRKLEELSETEKPIFTSFSDEEYVKKLVECLCLEEQKGQDRFCPKRAAMFKGLFRNFGTQFLPLFKPHLERLMAESDPANHESSHRVAAEILSGLMRGSKHWKFTDIQDLWSWVLPQLEKVLNSLSVENVAFWAKCLELCSESRDPRRIKPLFDLLMDTPLRGDGGSFGDSGRVRILQGFLTQQEWRVPAYQAAVLDIVYDNISHAYKNVRDRLASFMTTVFTCDRQVEHGSVRAAPKQEEFLQKLMPMWNAMADEMKKLNAETTARDDEDWKAKQRMCKTTVNWLKESFHRITPNITPDVYALLPLMCLLVSDCDDEELKSTLSHVLKLMPRTQVHKDNVPVLLATIQEISELSSWHAKVALLKFIQAHVFYNIFTLAHSDTKTTVKTLVLRLLRDDHLEVRELAAVTFGGLLQCGYFDFNKDLLDHFEKLSGDKKRKRRAALKEPLSTEALVKRHAGVLGLCSCVLAYPYDVPEFVPAILMDLSGHLDDPQPIQLTVKKALSNFRRTHHDNWQGHKQKFTDDQLVILTDVLVSPNYYA